MLKRASQLLLSVMFGIFLCVSMDCSVKYYEKDGRLVEEKMATLQKLALQVGYSKAGIRGIRAWLATKQTLKMEKKYYTPESVNLIGDFIKDFGIDMKEAEKPAEQFINHAEFFVRRLKPNARLINWDPKLVGSSADCKLSYVLDVGTQTHFKVKNEKFFSLKEFLNLSDENFTNQLVEEFKDGTILIFRLAPGDYHRYHFPFDCLPGKAQFIDGDLESVSPLAYEAGVNPLYKNERHFMVLESEVYGKVLMIPVGATIVGHIVHTYIPGFKVRKGEEAGYMDFGASTVCLVFKKGVVVPLREFIGHQNQGYETQVSMGQAVARLSQYSPSEKDRRMVQSALKGLVNNLKAFFKSKDNKNGQDINFKTSYGWTALHAAAYAGKNDAVNFLLDLKADVNAQAYDQTTPLHLAAQAGQEKTVKLLIDHGADSQATDNLGWKPIHHAARSVSVLKVLLPGKKETSVNARTIYGQTPLHFAAKHGAIDPISFLLSKGADINAQDNNGWTPLHYSAYCGDFATKYLLTTGGANAGLLTKDGKTALDLANENLRDLGRVTRDDKGNQLIHPRLEVIQGYFGKYNK